MTNVPPGFADSIPSVLLYLLFDRALINSDYSCISAFRNKVIYPL